VDKAVIDTVSKFKQALLQQGIKVNKVILYGSQVSGKAKEHSDIDIVVISDDFEEMNIRERLEIMGLAMAKARLMEPVEALGYTDSVNCLLTINGEVPEG